MAFKQPRVPEYRQSEGIEAYIKALILFLKDFCQETWMASRAQGKAIGGIAYPVTSVFGRMGDVQMKLDDLKSVQRASWNGRTAPADIPAGFTYVAAGSVSDGHGFPVGFCTCFAIHESADRLIQVLIEKANGRMRIRSAADASTWGEWQEYRPIQDTYPVGAIYLSVSSVSPASLFGGTWERITDRFLLAAGTSYSAGDEGGERAVALVTSHLPSSTIILVKNGTGAAVTLGNAGWIADNWGAEAYRTTSIANAQSKGLISYSGGGAHNNMPPYVAVYMWKRVS